MSGDTNVSTIKTDAVLIQAYHHRYGCHEDQARQRHTHDAITNVDTLKEEPGPSKEKKPGPSKEKELGPSTEKPGGLQEVEPGAGAALLQTLDVRPRGSLYRGPSKCIL